MESHFVKFYSPGTFMPEETVLPITSWDIDEAKIAARAIKERYAAVPFGFRFSTRARGDTELDSCEVAKSAMYYLGGTVLTLEDVEARADPRDDILLSNMRNNGISRIIQNDNSWRFTGALDDEDTVLEWDQCQTP